MNNTTLLASVAAAALLSGCQTAPMPPDPTGRADADMLRVLTAYQASGAKPIYTLSVAGGSPQALTHTEQISETNPPAKAPWGDCNADWGRENILSPYPYKTAQEHYEALMAQARAHGGPTVYAKATVPESSK